MHRQTILAALLAFLLSIAPAAHAAIYTIGGQAYITAATTENLSAPFTTPNGATSTALYSGLLQITVSDFGQSRATQLNDAFYLFTNNAGTPITPTPGPLAYHQLVVDNATLGIEDALWDASNYIVYDIDANLEITSRPYLPAYRANHTYSFIIDTAISPLSASFPAQLHFGVSDGNFGDNTGGYSLQLTQLTPVPEPSTILVVAASYFLVMRRRRNIFQ